MIHCFSENKAFAERALDLDFDLSFSGIVTFKRALDIQEVAAWAPQDRILVETDSPYLAPVPLRGKRCEPALASCTRPASSRACAASPLEELAAQLTSQNAQRRLGVSAVLKLSGSCRCLVPQRAPTAGRSHRDGISQQTPTLEVASRGLGLRFRRARCC